MKHNIRTAIYWGLGLSALLLLSVATGIIEG